MFKMIRDLVGISAVYILYIVLTTSSTAENSKQGKSAPSIVIVLLCKILTEKKLHIFCETI